MSGIIDSLAGHIDTVAVVFIGLLVAVFALFSIERALYKVYLMARVRARWFPEGRFVLACTTEDDHWDTYLQENLLPGLEDCAVIVPARQIGLTGDFERRLVDTFMENSCLEPAVVVFLPNLEFRVIRFGEALRGADEDGGRMLAKARERLMDLVDEQKDRIKLYI